MNTKYVAAFGLNEKQDSIILYKIFNSTIVKLPYVHIPFETASLATISLTANTTHTVVEVVEKLENLSFDAIQTWLLNSSNMITHEDTSPSGYLPKVLVELMLSFPEVDFTDTLTYLRTNIFPHDIATYSLPVATKYLAYDITSYGQIVLFEITSFQNLEDNQLIEIISSDFKGTIDTAKELSEFQHDSLLVETFLDNITSKDYANIRNVSDYRELLSTLDKILFAANYVDLDGVRSESLLECMIAKFNSKESVLQYLPN